ncbi:AvrD family protein [Kitasatospora sp. NPDC056651]|uniref:AvrD family protein n=1 Tax=Kitasatospora sp. NPDC056651 TaxID=3345892 RepID=UPI0036A8B6F1
MTTQVAHTLLASVDDYLGPGDRRFFGRGFRRVHYDLSRIRVARTPDGVAGASATVRVRYPADWSRKAVGDLRPHFSTVDGLVLAAQLAELCLSDRRGDDLSEAWLRQVRITAGNRPQEDLDRLEAVATRRRLKPLDGTPGWSVSVIDCGIGTMRVRCELVHPSDNPSPGQWQYANPAEALGPAADRYYDHGFTTRRQLIRDVVVDQGALLATARLDIEHEEPASPAPRGLESGHGPSVTMVDAFVTALQLAQVMLYEMDGVRRQDSDTLWMRQTVMTAAGPRRPYEAGVPVTTTLTEPDLLRLNGDTWRTMTITADMAGIDLSCAVTHRLPAGHPSAVPEAVAR